MPTIDEKTIEFATTNPVTFIGVVFVLIVAAIIVGLIVAWYKLIYNNPNSKKMKSLVEENKRLDNLNKAVMDHSISFHEHSIFTKAQNEEIIEQNQALKVDNIELKNNQLSTANILKNIVSTQNKQNEDFVKVGTLLEIVVQQALNKK